MKTNERHTVNAAILFDHERAEAKASEFGASLRALPADDTSDSPPMYEIRLDFDTPIGGRVDLTRLDDVEHSWTVDPYFDGDKSLTADEARSVARTLESAADLADYLNLPDDLESWGTIKGMTINQLADYAKSIGSPAATVLRAAVPK